MNIIGIIPARYASSRFPGKPLVSICGKPMIRRVYEQAVQSKSLCKVVVATDDQRIFNAVKNFGGNVVMTSPDHPNGTSRCLEAVEIIENREHGKPFDTVINIQGDEPFIQPAQIDLLAELFIKSKNIKIGTLAKKITSGKELFSPHVVKVVFDNRQRALYFSRQAIPFVRQKEKDEWISHNNFYKHIGLYGYRKDVLNEITGLPQGNLEQAENLEQLRWLEHGLDIHLNITTLDSFGIDTPDDLSKLTNNPC